jgi:imidazole glycerol phosphate synthase glutamine amidotransferase subunit
MYNAPGSKPAYGLPGKLSGNVQLLDIGGGNVGSLTRFLQELGVVAKAVPGAGDLVGTTPIIMSGVGSFERVMSALKDEYYLEKLSGFIHSGTPFLGIGIGMQVLFSYSEESPGIPGMGVFPGEIVRFKKGNQSGNNKIVPTPAVQGQYPKEEFVYFFGSYFAKPAQPEIIAFNGNYLERFCAGVKFRNATGFQFYPEKSKEAGARLMTAWLREALV